jgi:hypothetical protein
VNQSICVASYEQGHRSGEVHFRTKVGKLQTVESLAGEPKRDLDAKISELRGENDDLHA